MFSFYDYASYMLYAQDWRVAYMKLAKDIRDLKYSAKNRSRRQRYAGHKQATLVERRAEARTMMIERMNASAEAAIQRSARLSALSNSNGGHTDIAAERILPINTTNTVTY